VTAIVRTVRLTAAESFWYVLGCVGFGAMYFGKVPAKKALSEAGLGQMTSAEQFWYVLQCIAFGAGYFAKVPIKKALSEMPHLPGPGYDQIRSGYRGPDQFQQDSQPSGVDRRAPEQSGGLPPVPRHSHHNRGRGEGS
jgi:hypothetical protein